MPRSWHCWSQRGTALPEDPSLRGVRKQFDTLLEFWMPGAGSALRYDDLAQRGRSSFNLPAREVGLAERHIRDSKVRNRSIARQNRPTEARGNNAVYIQLNIRKLFTRSKRSIR
jgi:hypothetical protein